MKIKLLTLLLLSLGYITNAQTYSSSGVVTIADGTGACGATGAPALSTLTVSATGTISTPDDVTINVNINHDYVGDLAVALVAPDLSTCILLNHIGATTCDGFSGALDGANTLSFNSSYTTPVPTTTNPVPAGNYAPTASVAFPAVGDLGTFLLGKSVNGNWSLRVVDHFGSFTGSIISWNMVLGATALPLDLLSFTGRINSNNGYNEFEWKTGVEKLTHSFELERSNNGSNFIKAGTIMAVGTGNNTYTYKDIYTTSGNVYYRLKMIDIDGTSGFSNTIRLNNSEISSKIARIFPNPAKANLELIIENDIDLLGTQAQLIDMTGRTVLVIEIKEPNQQLDIKNLTPGLYSIRLANGEIIKFKKVD
ncbi:MAG: proprotein convertase P-domain-containing protein [Chitinophagaceae bacterium]|jgi:subtilisin-like proprotein convertase family protein